MAARARIGFVIGVIVAGVVMFVVSSAWMHSRGVPWFLCAAGGAMVFPVLPLAWHLWSERRRRAEEAAAKGPAKAKASLTGGDRLVMRLVVVAAVTLGPLVFFRGGETWRAVREHGTWFIPSAPKPPRVLSGDPRLVAQVPADAELVLWVRAMDALSADQGEPRADDEADEVLLAFRDGELMIVARGPDRALSKIDLAEINGELSRQPWLPIKGPLVARRRANDLLVVVTEGWAASADDRAAGKGNGPTTLVERLAGAPRDAVIIAAAAPSRPVAGLSVSGAQSWLRVSEKEIRLDGELFVADKAAATAVTAALRAAIKDLEGSVPGECKQPIGGLLGKLVIDTGETSVRISGRWSGEQIGEAAMCALGMAMKQMK